MPTIADMNTSFDDAQWSNERIDGIGPGARVRSLLPGHSAGAGTAGPQGHPVIDQLRETMELRHTFGARSSSQVRSLAGVFPIELASSATIFSRLLGSNRVAP
jgi:hypothetical protein